MTGSAAHSRQSRHKVEDSLRQIAKLLGKQRLVEAMVRDCASPRHELIESLAHRQHSVELPGARSGGSESCLTD
ncbi:MAG: hypothetical protein V9H25_20980 [Candidatus Competibacter sp.]